MRPGAMVAAVALGLLMDAGGQLEGQMVLSGDPAILSVYSAVAGSSPQPVIDDATTYSVEVVEPSVIEVYLDAPPPAGVTIHLQMEPPPGASSAGVVRLSTTPQAVITSIPTGSYSGLSLTYEVSATVAAGVVPLGSRQVSFTVKAAS